jgi:hypothetical protein
VSVHRLHAMFGLAVMVAGCRAVTPRCQPFAAIYRGSVTYCRTDATAVCHLGGSRRAPGGRCGPARVCRRNHSLYRRLDGMQSQIDAIQSELLARPTSRRGDL